MIAIIDYGLGNIRAFVNVYKQLNIPAKVVRNSNDIIDADKIILPGVGSFDYAMQRLNQSGMREALDESVLVKKKLVLGICVGMQMLAKSSKEGILPGLKWINASVERFDSSSFKHQACIPHMGWNTIQPLKNEKILTGFDDKLTRFYFLHSYYFECNNPDDSIAVTDYHGKFTSIVRHDNIYGVQFHPEKSHRWGIKLLKNFSKL